MKRHYLVKFQADYADEFDVYGFTVMDEKYYKQFMSDLNNVEWPNENYFGSNEAITFHSLEDYMQSITVTEISESEVKTLNKLFGSKYSEGASFGKFMDPGEY